MAGNRGLQWWTLKIWYHTDRKVTVTEWHRSVHRISAQFQRRVYFTDSIFTREHLCTFCSVIMSPTIHQIQIKGQRRGKAQRQTKPTFGGHNERMAEICASMLLCCLVGHSTKYSRGYDISHYVVDTVQDFLGIKSRLHIHIENKHFFTKSCHHQTYR